MGATDTAFAGAIPAIYERYLVPLMFQPYAEDLAARLQDMKQGRILETAAGTGAVTRAVSRVLPDAEIVSTDFNQAMLDLAAEKHQAPQVTWQQVDAQNLPFEDSAFDAVICQFGVMFFPDKVQAYREALRVLKPGGRFIFSVWDRLEQNPLSQAVSDAVIAMFEENPPRFIERVPFAYFDDERIDGELEQAGFENINIEPVEKVTQAPSPQDMAIGLCQGTPLRSELEARAPSRLEEITDKVAEALAARFGPSSLENRMRALVVTAWR